MSEEVLAEVTPASEQVVTATPEPEVKAPELPVETPKTFTQEDLDAAIGKRLAIAQRKWEREQAQRLAETQLLKAPVAVPPADQFESPEAYAEALALQKAEELVAQREAAKRQTQVLDSYHEREEDARSKYDDFEQVAYNRAVPITQTMAEAIRESEVGPDVAYYLGTNIDEASRISKLSIASQAREIGKIEAKLAAAPPVKKTSSAPAPITPVTPRSSSAPSYDTTDPRSIKTMTTSEWIEADRRRQIAKMEARNR